MSIEDRLTRLERSARRWKLAAVGALVVAGAMGAAKGVPDEVRARTFVVVNDKGDERGWFGMSPREGRPSFSLRDEGGRSFASIDFLAGQEEAETILTLGVPSHWSTFTQQSDGAVVELDKHELYKPRFRLDTYGDRVSVVQWRDREGKVIAGPADFVMPKPKAK